MKRGLPGYVRLEAGLKTVGAGENLKAAAEPLCLETHGDRIAVLNFAEHEFGSATAQDAGCAVLDPLSISPR